ncbi:hypothetical protein ACGFNP_33385 [Nonomuraea sp. NPDC049269]|uniref:hypothetical protein n=1 Tax=Nonomuraea sp. NPDC049269 TaxID=3364349 RepID=UPI0037156DBF
MRKATCVLAALVLAGACVLAADTALGRVGRTADDAVESASRWTVRYTAQGGLRVVPTAGGGALLFTTEGRRPGWSMLRWDGSSWKSAELPTQFDKVSRLEVGGSPSGETIWAVGPAWADGGSPIVLHWDRTQWKQVSLNVVRTGLTAVRTDPASGLWIAANPSSGAPYVLNLRDGSWTRSTLPGAGPADRIIDIAPAPGTTRLWVRTEHQRDDKITSLVYELR